MQHDHGGVMADLKLKGSLDLKGTLTLVGDSGGKVKVGDKEALVELQPGGTAFHTQSATMVQLPTPANAVDRGQKVYVICSFNKTVKVKTSDGEKALVTQGIAQQGNSPTWPG